MIDKKELIKYYVFLNISFVIAYSFLSHSILFVSSELLQLLISIDLIVVGCYSLFIDNGLLNISDKAKSTLIAIISEYALVWEFVKLATPDHARSAVNYIYAALIFLHVVLFSRFSDLFLKFVKFNFGFSVQYAILFAFSSRLNPIIPCAIIGTVAAMYKSITLDYMTVFSSCFIYSFMVFEGVVPLLIILLPSKDEATVLISMLVVAILIFILYVVAVYLQFRAIKRQSLPTSVEPDDSEDSRNYSTFSDTNDQSQPPAYPSL